MTFEVRFLSGVADVPAADWDRLLGPGSSAFEEWAFLAACEAASATPEHGILPRHVALYDGGRLAAALPLYVKGDGRAEFVYDWDWHQVAARQGIEYYPKAVAMAPFTPVPGARFLVEPGFDRALAVRTLAAAAEAWALEVGLSGVHYLFLEPGEADLLAGEGRLIRFSSHLVLENDGLASFEDYVSRFRSKDRTKIRRQRRRFAEQGLEALVVEGDDLGADHLDAMHGFYVRTCAAYGTGSDYLQRGTWERLFETWRHRLVLCLAARQGRPVAGALAVARDGVLAGRYWGALDPLPDLHFNVALYQPIELLIERGWRRFDVGWGNTYGKFARGLFPEPVHSVHRIFDGRLARILERHLEIERRESALEIEWLARISKLRRR